MIYDSSTKRTIKRNIKETKKGKRKELPQRKIFSISLHKTKNLIFKMKIKLIKDKY